MILRMECGSSRSGRLAEGCVRCIEGAKMVLFVTGRCSHGCYYCPVSFDRKGKDEVFANERKVRSWDEIFEEADSMDAKGTGITGGDPLECMDRTLRAVRMLKERYGPGHHIHLYTATIDPEKVSLLEEAGLDEIRFHPPESVWMDMGRTKLKETVAALRIDVGIEVPALPGKERELNALITYAKDAGVDFVNLNELEFSESNWDMMDAHGYSVRDELSSAVAGSRETAMAVLKANRRANVHFCSSTFKDGVQLRRRLIRRAEHTAKPYQQVTEDGTIVRGYLYSDDLAAAEDALRSLGVPEDLYEVLSNKIEVAPWVLEDIAPSVKYRCFLSEQYPTADGLEVERTPLN